MIRTVPFDHFLRKRAIQRILKTGIAKLHKEKPEALSRLGLCLFPVWTFGP